MPTHKVRFLPVNIEIEVTEDETVLEAAFRQGVMLMHGCKEGQCSSCKSFLLDGDLEMKKYSTFALPEYESEEGYVLLCRSRAYSDLEVELLNYNEDILRNAIPIRTARAVVEEIEPLTHDIRRLLLKLVEPREMLFRAGQYVDIHVPGSDEVRSYSMANTPATDDHLEFMIKLFPGGLFTQVLEEQLKPGYELEVTGPYGVFMLREQSVSDIICIGGGSGMAPIWSLLSDMAERHIERRATYYYGARTRKDLFYLDEMERLTARLPGFRFVPALSEPGPDDNWDGEMGFVSAVVDRALASGQTTLQAYLCGPPPMIDAALVVLERKGITPDRIFFDKFTATGAVE